MDVTSKISIKLSKEDAAELLAKAVAKQLYEEMGITVSPADIEIRFTATLDYGYDDRGSGSPAFTGVDIEIKQPQQPRPKRSTTHNSLASQIASVESDRRPYGDH